MTWAGELTSASTAVTKTSEARNGVMYAFISAASCSRLWLVGAYCRNARISRAPSCDALEPVSGDVADEGDHPAGLVVEHVEHVAADHRLVRGGVVTGGDADLPGHLRECRQHRALGRLGCGDDAQDLTFAAAAQQGEHDRDHPEQGRVHDPDDLGAGGLALVPQRRQR